MPAIIDRNRSRSSHILSLILPSAGGCLSVLGDLVAWRSYPKRALQSAICTIANPQSTLYNQRFRLGASICRHPSLKSLARTIKRRRASNTLRRCDNSSATFTRTSLCAAKLLNLAGKTPSPQLSAKFHDFEPQTAEGQRPAPEEIELANQQLNAITVRLAGRIASPPRVMGKAAFVHLSDGVSRLQIYIRKADAKAVNNATRELIEEEGKGWELFELLDHGDFIGAEGYLFITKTGELSVHVTSLQFLAKALLPMPDKMHGIHDPEIRQRQRYADLIAGSLKLEHVEHELSPREVFERRSAVIREMRRFLDDHGYVEVETPMLTSKATGAAAKPFETYHNALSIPLYARIAPELYFKRLLVGGFEKVYELNRNFRNEGIDRTHNPEFTMLEFYWAYADVNQMMDFCEDMIRATVFKALGHTNARYGESRYRFRAAFQRLTMKGGDSEVWWRERLDLDKLAGEELAELFESNRGTATNSADLHHRFSQTDIAAFKGVAGGSVNR